MARIGEWPQVAQEGSEFLQEETEGTESLIHNLSLLSYLL
jgi:hypothetical protein